MCRREAGIEAAGGVGGATVVEERRETGISGNMLLGMWLCAGADMRRLVGRACTKTR